MPIGIDRPAIYFRDVNFVLSHTGHPWENEAINMALKFPNVIFTPPGATPQAPFAGALTPQVVPFTPPAGTQT